MMVASVFRVADSNGYAARMCAVNRVLFIAPEPHAAGGARGHSVLFFKMMFFGICTLAVFVISCG